MSAVQIYNLVRGVTHPYPGAFTFLDGKKIMIWRPGRRKEAANRVKSCRRNRCWSGPAKGLLEIKTLQYEGEEEVTASELVAR